MHIREQLTSSPAFREVADTRVFSFPIEQGTTLPYVTYSLSNITPDNTKDGWNGDNTLVTVEVVAQDSSAATQLAEIVREVLEDHDVDYDDWRVSAGVMSRAVSGYSLDLGLSVVAMDYVFVIS